MEIELQRCMMDTDSFNFECIISENETIDEALAPFQDAVIIVASGGCRTDKRIGHYTTLLLFRGNHKLLKGSVENTTSANYSILQGVLKAVESIKTSIPIVVVTNTNLGFQGGCLKNKGRNKEMIQKIRCVIMEKKCALKELQIMAAHGSLHEFIARYYPGERKDDDKQKRINQYTERIKAEAQKQTLDAVVEILQQNHVPQVVIDSVLSIHI